MMIILAIILPGTACVYYGEEIAMENNYDITWEQSNDPLIRKLDRDTFYIRSRDPNRTPFQWDDTMNAGKEYYFNNNYIYIYIYIYALL
jgi:alpha-glucosidase